MDTRDDVLAWARVVPAERFLGEVVKRLNGGLSPDEKLEVFQVLADRANNEEGMGAVFEKFFTTPELYEQIGE